jgi:hypothetical protein
MRACLQAEVGGRSRAVQPIRVAVFGAGNIARDQDIPAIEDFDMRMP